MAFLYTGVRWRDAVKRSLVLCCSLLFPLIWVHAQSPDRTGPKIGDPAPALDTHLLLGPRGAKVDWNTLRGKVVILQFRDTGNGLFVSDIPYVNRLAKSLDSRKIQFISVTNEDPATVKAFVKKNRLREWVISDNYGVISRRYGVVGVPTYVVIDTQGRVVAMTMRPSRLQRDGLLKLADGQSVAIESEADAKADAKLQSGLLDAIAVADREKYSELDPLFSLSITLGDATQKPENMHGRDWIEVKNETPDQLMENALSLPPGRVKLSGELPKTVYNLRFQARSLDSAHFAKALDLAVESVCGVKIDRQTSTQDVYVLQAMDKTNLSQPSWSPDFDLGHLKMGSSSNVTVELEARMLEHILGRPVLNESGLSSPVRSSDISLPDANFEALKSALEKTTGLTLIPVQRPIETITLTPNPGASGASDKPAL